MKRIVILMVAVFYGHMVYGQDSAMARQKFIYFPHSLQHKWTTSIGLTGTTMPYEITEELHYRIPAGDFHVLRKLSDQWSLDGRINFQIVQNIVSLGPHWATPLTDRLSLGVADDIGYWIGFINVEGFKTKGRGWQNYPSVSLGYRFNKGVLLTVKADAIMTMGIKTYAGHIPVTTNYDLFSGSSYTVMLEQPFYGQKHLSLGFRAIYTNFFWQTWTAFTNFDRNFFYPQIIVGLIL